MKGTSGFGGRGYKFDESEKEMKKMKQRIQQAAIDPESVINEEAPGGEDGDVVCFFLYSSCLISYNWKVPAHTAGKFVGQNFIHLRILL